MLDDIARAFLLTGLAATLAVAIETLRHTVRTSRRGAIWAMIPTLTLWIVFEISALAGVDIVWLQWLSRVGVIGIVASFLHQLWSIRYAEEAENRVRDRL